MKRYFVMTLIVSCLGMLSWAQASRELFDSKKSEAELEIMKGILGTTISRVTQVQEKSPWRIYSSNMTAYYLVGQGAVFVIPTSSFQSLDLSPFYDGEDVKLAIDLSRIKEQSQAIALEAQKQAAEIRQYTQVLANTARANQGAGIGPGIGGGEGSGIAAPPTPAAPPAPAAAPAPPAPPAPPQTGRDEVFKKMDEFRAAAKKNREEAAANQQKFLESLKELHAPLIEALANYGDSLTQVKPGEYINLILYTDTLSSDFGRAKARHDVLSAQKSWITDYKAGRITLESFKQKVLQYTE